jgi:hypothetical protein
MLSHQLKIVPSYDWLRFASVYIPYRVASLFRITSQTHHEVRQAYRDNGSINE